LKGKQPWLQERIHWILVTNLAKLSMVKKLLLELLTYWPEKSPYVLRKILKFLRDLLSPLQKTNMSSTYKIWEGVRSPCGLVICRILLSFISLEIPLLRTFSTRQKSKGDKGSPCLTPLLQGKKPTKLSFILIEYIIEQRIVLIQQTNEGCKPKRVKINNKNF